MMANVFSIALMLLMKMLRITISGLSPGWMSSKLLSAWAGAVRSLYRLRQSSL